MQRAHAFAIQPRILRKALSPGHANRIIALHRGASCRIVQHTSRRVVSHQLASRSKCAPRQCRPGHATAEARTHLAHQQRHAAPHELAHGPRVRVQVAAREALVRAVEEHKVPPREHDVRDLAPLLLARVHARGVVCARVHEEHGARRCGLERVEVRPEGEPDRGGIVVGVRKWGDPDALEYLNMVY
ncbi:hypothetical protein AcW1_005806 [Taiwanofungus camphoratus]|nr:hypothetical protein AcW1_005806 [Antrodia cinnamomea]